MKTYPSDLSDEQWELLKDFVAQGKMGRPRTVNIREVINAILHVVKTGCQWRMLPHHFPPWKTVYDHYRRMKERGVWEQINERLNKASRQKKGET